MVSETCIKFLKMTVFALNLIMGLVGIVGISIAAFYFHLMTQATHDDKTSLWAGSFGDANQIIRQARVVMCIFMLTIGAGLLIVGLVGCCGAAVEQRCLLVTSAGLLGVLLTMEIVGIGLIMWQRQHTPQLVDDMMSTRIRYSDNYEADDWRSIHAIQRHLRCCGVNGYRDYIEANHSMPMSCCNQRLVAHTEYHQCSYYLFTHPYMLANDTLLYKRGCSAVVRQDMENFAVLGFCCIAVLMFIQMVNFVFSCIIAQNGDVLSGLDARRTKPGEEPHQSTSYAPADDVQQYHVVPPAYENPSKSSLGGTRIQAP